ncbi:mechanosensitive ion channel domain-containing protein [uncultured Thiohalocapsa sp.]|uniref:mechanosensitive ion channel domain-containing protein n=1 Tax=uncultured Thiohalocapsa sp. TaxID=768990 RepID=UPI0026013C93|nr:mechanosensitive ion channel domain-containing protein [uncultured Thiohalocapsa sp.]
MIPRFAPPLRPAARRRWLWAALLLCTAAAAQPDGESNTGPDAEPPTELHAEPQAEPPAATTTVTGDGSRTRALVEQRLEEIEAATNLADEERKRLTGELNTVLKDLADAARLQAAAADYAAAIEQTPAETQAIGSALAEAANAPPSAETLDLPEDADLPIVESRISAEQAEIAALEARIARLSEALEAGDLNPTQIRERIAAIDARLTELGPPADAPDTSADPEREIQSWARQARRSALRAERQMLEQQLVSAGARRELTLARRDEARAALERAKARRALLENRADALRRQAAETVQQKLADERAAAAGAHPLVRTWAERNTHLGEAVAKTTAELDQLDEQRSDLERQRARIEEDFANARERLEAAGLNRAQGQVLIEQRGRLPDARRLRRSAAERADQIAESTLRSIRWREELRQLDDLDAWVDTAVAELPPAQLEQVDQDRLRAALRAQGETRRGLLRTALDLEDSYRRALGEVDFAGQQLRELVQRYDRYLSERLLWVRSIGPITEQSFAALPAAIIWVISPRNWAGVGNALATEATRSPALWLGVGVVGLLLWRNAALRRAIRASAEPLRRISTDRFRYTLTALGLTLLAAAPWPLLAVTLGHVLRISPAADGFVKAVGAAFIAIVPALYYLLAFRMLCLRGGVADRHFRWRSDTLVLLRRSAYIAATLLVPVGFIAAMLHNQQNPVFAATLGRLSLGLFDLGLAVLTAVVLHPTRGILKHVLAEHPDAWYTRLRMLWYPFLVAVPLVLAGLALSGFLYTSGVLLRSLVNELWLALGLVIAHQLIARWLLVTRRRLALNAALERRAQREAARAAEAAGAEALAVQEGTVDLASLDAQTRRLLNLSIYVAAAVGLWLIWSEVLPALNFFDRFTLWRYTGTVDGVEQAIPVTLADLGLVLVIIVAAVMAARNLPALLEILLLQSSRVSAGSRYTIITLTGYAITAVGALLVFGALGLSWGQVQWLVAALGVGIGFGLQEIVANFISGLIILFERPVRVGDIVTIGETTGVVTRIEIRATTVRNWDRQELLVPNKELITGRITNWTLTDQINRIVIPVGVEYGSDTRKALQILADVARENEHVLEDPAPLITFEGFGNDALTLVLRCYLQDMDYRLDTITALHQAIDDRFRAAGIGIAFPQRDIHLRSAQPLEIRLHRGARATPAGTDAG